MNILLTGATGYLGSHLLAALLSQGHRVVVIKRSTSSVNRIESLLGQVDFIDVDKEPIEKAFAFCKIDLVIHAATVYGRKGEPILDLFKANLNFPFELLTLAIEHGTDFFINTDTILNPFVTPYALSKKQFNDWGAFFAHKKKVHFISVKLQNLYGPDDDKTKIIPYVIQNCLLNTECLDFTSGEQLRDFIYISDVVDAYLLLVNQIAHTMDFYQEVGLGTAKRISVKTLVEKIGVLSHATTQFKFGVLEARDTEFESKLADISYLQTLGWVPQHSLEQGLIKTIDAERERLCVI